MKIVYTKHAAIDKFMMLKKHNFNVGKRFIKEVIKNSEHEERQENSENIIVSGSIDEKHILRVVYRRENDIIRIITFYPAEKGRYY